MRTPKYDFYDMVEGLKKTYTTNTIDGLLYYLFETDFSSSEKDLIKDLMLKRKNAPGAFKKSNAKLVDDDFCTRYAQMRAIGLSQTDAAALLGISLRRLESILAGDGISDYHYEKLLSFERRGDIALKEKCLQTIDNAIGNGNWKAAMAMLEKRFPDEYGKRIEVKSNSVVQWSADACESNANKAKADLERIRLSRTENQEERDLYVEAESTN